VIVPEFEDLTPEALGARYMTSSELQALAERLRTVACWIEELRFLRLERERTVLERHGHRPTIGYYLRSRASESGEGAPGSSFEPPPAPTASRGRSEAPARSSPSGRLASSPRGPASASRSPSVSP